MIISGDCGLAGLQCLYMIPKENLYKFTKQQEILQERHFVIVRAAAVSNKL